MSATSTVVTSPAVVDGRYVIVSTDGHAGASVMAYRDYLPAHLCDEFDEWVKKFENPFADTEGPTASATGTRSAGCASSRRTVSSPRSCSRTPCRPSTRLRT